MEPSGVSVEVTKSCTNEMEGVGSLIQTLRGFRVLEDASRFEEAIAEGC